MTNNLLCAEQFGFRTGCSIDLAALELVDHMISQIDNGYNPLNIRYIFVHIYFKGTELRLIVICHSDIN